MTDDLTFYVSPLRRQTPQATKPADTSHLPPMRNAEEGYDRMFDADRRLNGEAEEYPYILHVKGEMGDEVYRWMIDVLVKPWGNTVQRLGPQQYGQAMAFADEAEMERFRERWPEMVTVHRLFQRRGE